MSSTNLGKHHGQSPRAFRIRLGKFGLQGLSNQNSPAKSRRDGNISFVYLIVCVMCSVVTVFLLNVAHVTHQKLQMQNAADSAAIASTTWMTRGMNAVTATNHVMGEMAGMVVIHHAFGGYPLDQGRLATPSDYPDWDYDKDGPDPSMRRDSTDPKLHLAASKAKAAGALTPTYDEFVLRLGERRTTAGLALLDAKIVLRNWLIFTYRMKSVAKAMQQSSIAPIVAAGIALEKSMDIFEEKIFQEYAFLIALQELAVELKPLKEKLRDRMLPAARDYTDHVVEKFPELAKRAAKAVGKELGVEVELYPRWPALPVIKDPHRYAMSPLNLPKVKPHRNPPPNPTPRIKPKPREQVVKTSQLARATFPWVVYHRQTILKLLVAMAPLSNARRAYKHWTDGSTKRLMDEFQRPGGLELGLYVLKGATPPDKGYELWTEDRHLLDEVFSVQAFAWREKPIVIGQELFFQQQHDTGRIAVSQALLYNGNRQRRHRYHTPLHYKRILPERQADVGWDTLNWAEGLKPYELVATTRRGPVQSIYPEIKVNWQSKLVPVSVNRLGKAREHLPEPYRSILKKIDMRFPQLQTH
jgi:hypothetical protein